MPIRPGRIAFAVAIAAVAAPAAATYYGLELSAHDLRAFDWASHERAGPIARLTVLNAIPASTGDGDFTEDRWEVDCDGHKVHITGSNDYRLGSSDPVSSLPLAAPWTSADPGTIGAEILDVACAAAPPADTAMGDLPAADVVRVYRSGVADGTFK